MKIFLMVFAVAMLGGCASSHTLIGEQKTRQPIDVGQVKIYSKPPAKYEEIAILDASSKGSISFGDQAKMEKAIERLKQEAADLGANGVLLQGVGTENGGTVYTGTANSYGNTTYGSGVAIQAHHKRASGIAIFVPTDGQVEQPNVSNSNNEKSQRLRDLQQLKNDGLISDDEYQLKRKQIIDSL